MKKKKPKSTGPKRMKELGKRKVEVWFTKAQWEELDNLAQLYNTRPATFARRATNFVVAGGANTARPLQGTRYD